MWSPMMYRGDGGMPWLRSRISLCRNTRVGLPKRRVLREAYHFSL